MHYLAPYAAAAGALGLIVAALIYVALKRQPAGTAAMLPTPLAAWGANLLFLSAAIYMLLTVRT